MVLVMTAVSVVTQAGLASIFNPGAHGFTEALYAYTSQSNNNGSAFAGYGATNFSATLGTVALLLRPLRAADRRRSRIGGSLAAKKTVPASAGTFRTDGPTFGVLLVGVIVAHRRPDDLPGAHARADRGRADALMRATRSPPSSRSSSSRVVFGFALPGADDRLRAGRVPATRRTAA